MSELRFDPTTADWVVFAPLRRLRPRLNNDFGGGTSGPSVKDGAERCPFCPGNETLTPHEIDAIRVEGIWRVRVIPNKFPALQIEEEHRRVQDGILFEKMGGCGAHEVIIESPDHDVPLARQSESQVELVLQMLQRRYIDLMRDRRFQSIVIFKNHGERAGTSLHHPHWQLIATPVVPRLLRMKSAEAATYFDRTGECLYQVLLNEELEAEKRIVAANEHFVAFLPYAGHLPFETWIMPRQAQSSFAQLQPTQIEPLAQLLRLVLLKLNVGLEDPDFNLTIDTSPRGEEEEPFFCWHIRVLPRLATAAGFELGSGMSINTVLPEEAAEFLRSGNGLTPPEG